MKKDYIEEIMEEFDEKFGKAGPEKNSDSIGRMAGCDDCFSNIMLRGEHKSFIKQALEEQKQEIKNWCKQRCEDNIKTYGTDKWNGDLEDLIKII